MKIGIVDADLMDNGTRHPNLALMKIAGYYIENGDEVRLIYKDYLEIKDYDMVFISKVFTFTKVSEWVLKEKNVSIGGTGFFEDGGTNLEDAIEHHMPYYDLYLDYVNEKIEEGCNRKNYEDYLEYSIGFLTRGCFRKCSFCVNKKYDSVNRHSSVQEFLSVSRPKIYLWDDNFLGFPEWEECLDELEKTGKPFQFRQGIDIRLMDDRKAYRFNNTKWHGDFIFAFDHLEDRDIICKNIQLWKKYTNKQPKLYVISGYDSQDAYDIANVFERIGLLMKYGCVPYIMRYIEYKNSKYKGMYIQIARWCNQPQFYKKMSFREFCERNQFYHPNKNTLCSAYKAMVDFEKENPEIAQKYFDLKFMNENIFSINYGYGHRYYNKAECTTCKLAKCSWEDIVAGNVNNAEILKLYLERELELRCLHYSNCECRSKADICAGIISNNLISANNSECEQAISLYEERHRVRTEECIVPDLALDKCIKMLKFLQKTSDSKEFVLNDILNKLEADTVKKKKQIKRELKILSFMDLVYFSRNTRNAIIEVSDLGICFLALDYSKKEKLYSKLQYRFPLIQLWIRYGKNQDSLIESLPDLNKNEIKLVSKFFDKVSKEKV